MEYSLCAVPLRLVCVPRSMNARVTRILESLFSLMPGGQGDRAIEILINDMSEEDMPEGDVAGEVVFQAPGLSAIRTARGYHLRSGESFLSLDLSSGRAAGSLSPAFMDSPPEDQRGIFLFALLLLLPARGLYALHAGGVHWDDSGFLIVGGSGSGKTTVTCALTRSGWQYLSDDSVLLKRGPRGVEALSFGRPFHCAPAMFRHFPELARGAGAPAEGRASAKRLVDAGRVYPGRFLGSFRPRVILFPEIADAPSSSLEPMGRTPTLLRLLREGAGLLHSRDSMAAQMAILGDLARSAPGFRLIHGADVHHDPEGLSALLKRIKGDYIDAAYSAA